MVNYYRSTAADGEGTQEHRRAASRSEDDTELYPFLPTPAMMGRLRQDRTILRESERISFSLERRCCCPRAVRRSLKDVDRIFSKLNSLDHRALSVPEKNWLMKLVRCLRRSQRMLWYPSFNCRREAGHTIPVTGWLKL